MATHSSVLAWRIPGMGEPGGLPSMGSHSWTRLKRLSSSSSVNWECPQSGPHCSPCFKRRAPWVQIWLSWGGDGGSLLSLCRRQLPSLWNEVFNGPDLVGFLLRSKKNARAETYQVLNKNNHYKRDSILCPLT